MQRMSLCERSWTEVKIPRAMTSRSSLPSGWQVRWCSFLWIDVASHAPSGELAAGKPASVSARENYPRSGVCAPLPTHILLLVRVSLDHLVQEVAAFIDGTHAYAFVQPMSTVAVGIAEHAREAIGGNARRGEKGTIGSAR